MSVERNIRRNLPETDESDPVRNNWKRQAAIIISVFIACVIIFIIVIVIYNRPVKLLEDIDPKEITVIEVKDINNKHDFKIEDSGHIEHIIKDISSFTYKRDGFSTADDEAIFKIVLKNKKGTEVEILDFISPEIISSGLFNYKTEVNDEVLPLAYIWGLSLRGTDILADESNA